MTDQHCMGSDLEAAQREQELAKLRHFRSLGLRAKLEAVQGMADVIRGRDEMGRQEDFRNG